MLANGTIVKYHGSMTGLSGAKFVISNRTTEVVVAGLRDASGRRSADGIRYTLTPVVPGTVSRSAMQDYIWNVRRQSFTVVNREGFYGFLGRISDKLDPYLPVVQFSWRYGVMGVYKDRYDAVVQVYPLPFVRLTW